MSCITLALTMSCGAGAAIAAGDFDRLDTDNDNQLSRAELRSHIDGTGAYRNWDRDGDGRINENEYERAGFDGDFDAWNVDDNDYLDDNEVHDGIFGLFDDDESAHLDDGEWDDAGDAGFWDV